MADLFQAALTDATEIVDRLAPPLVGSQRQYMINMLVMMWGKGRDTGNADKMPSIGGIKVIATEAVAPGMIEFHHNDGRIDRFAINS